MCMQHYLSCCTLLSWICLLLILSTKFWRASPVALPLHPYILLATLRTDTLARLVATLASTLLMLDRECQQLQFLGAS
jgi:hypothetical protein